MGKPIETGFDTFGLVLDKRRVKNNAFVALISTAKGTDPIVVIRNESVNQVPTDPEKKLGHWTQLSEGAPYWFTEKLPVTVYGGDGPSNITPLVC